MFRGIKKGRKEGHPPLRSPINPTLPEGDNRRQEPVTSCVSQDSFIFPSPYVHITELPPASVCSRRLEIISHRKQADKKHRFPLCRQSLCCNKEIAPKTTRVTFRDAPFLICAWQPEAAVKFKLEIKNQNLWLFLRVHFTQRLTGTKRSRGEWVYIFSNSLIYLETLYSFSTELYSGITLTGTSLMCLSFYLIIRWIYAYICNVLIVSECELKN